MDFIIDNFDKLFDSEEHLKKLEEIILDLAVKGKLVPQNSDDEPASVLIEKIKAEKEKLIKEKKIKKDKDLDPIREEEKPFEIPDSWEWVRLEEITKLITCGYASTPQYVDEGKPFISAKNVKPNRFMPSEHQLISNELFDKLTLTCKPEKNDILVTRVGAGIGEAAIIDVDMEFAIYVSLTLIKPFQEYCNSKYFLNYILSKSCNKIMIGDIYGRNASQGNLNVSKMRNLIIPVPPLAEQKRIVEKIDSLKKLIDTLKEKAKVRDKTREELKKSIMAEIEKSDSNIDLLNSLEMVFKNFDTIVKNKEDIKDIRDLILSMAVKGKLVPQNSDDEPASVLIDKIKEEKEKLIKEKKIKKDKELEPIREEEKPFEIPDSWKWVRLGEIIEFTENSNIQEIYSKETIINYVDIDAIDNINFRIKEVKQKTVEELSSRARRVLKKGYIFYSMVRPYLKNIAIIEEEREKFIGTTGASVFKVYSFETKYIFRVLLSPYINNNHLELLKGFNSPSITQEQFIRTLIPIPPFAEQKRIVEKVDKLMALCDDLEKKVEKSQKEFEKILESTIKEVTANNAN